MGNNLCRKRETSQTDSKNPVDRIFGRFQICPNGLNRSDNIRVEKSSNIYQVPSWPANDNAPVAPPRSSPPKTIDQSLPLNAEWIDVPLKAPEPPPPNISMKKTIASLQQTTSPSAPVPPPRKHRRATKKVAEHTYSNEDRVPVEEPIIVPKKEIIHICDPTRHPHHYHKTADGARKAHSTIIPPVYNDLEVKKDAAKNTRRASIPRNASLPGEAGLSLSQVTAQRLESYMTRCRSFGSLLPQQIMDKIKNTPSTNVANNQSDVESEDSWGGLDDWDLGVIEHDGMQDGPPFTPSSRLPSKKRSPADVQFIVGSERAQQPTMTLSISKDAKLHENIDEPLSTVKNGLNGRKSGVNLQSILSATPSIVVTDSNEASQDTIDKPIAKQAPLARRESIEDIVDWFDNEPEPTQNPFIDANDKVLIEKTPSTPPENVLYDGQTNPFRSYQEDSSFHSDAFFTSKFLEHEKKANVVTDNINQAKDAVAETLDESKIQNTVVINEDQSLKKELNISTNLNTDTPKQTPQKDIYKSTNESTVTAKEANDPNLSTDDNIEHSSLLKFFKTDSKEMKDIQDSERPDRNNVKVDISGFH